MGVEAEAVVAVVGMVMGAETVMEVEVGHVVDNHF